MTDAKGGLIPDHIVDRVRGAIDIATLVGRAVKLAKKGSTWVGLCPFHDEKTPSFTVDPGRQRYHCYGCGADGDVFEWLVQREGLCFPEAVRALGAECGVDVPGGEAARELAPGAVDVAAEWAKMRRDVDTTALQRWLTARGVHGDTAAAAALSEGVVYVDGRVDSPLSRLLAYRRVGIALRDERGRVRDIERRFAKPGEGEEAEQPKSQRLKPDDRGELPPLLVFGDLSQVRAALHRGRMVWVVEGGPDWVVADGLARIEGAGAVVLGAATGELAALGVWLARCIRSMHSLRHGPPPVVRLIPDIGDSDRQGEVAMLEIVSALAGLAVCQWAAPVAEQRPVWTPRVKYRAGRWRATPGAGRTGVKADLGDLAALAPDRVLGLLEHVPTVLEEGPLRSLLDDDEMDSDDPWRPVRYDKLHRFLDALPLQTVADAIYWRWGKKGMVKMRSPECSWWLGALTVEWLRRRGARFGHDEAEEALVYWPHAEEHQGRLFPLRSRRFAKVLFDEGKIHARSQTGLELMQAIDAACLSGPPMVVRPWAYASGRELRVHLHDDLDRVAVARAGAVHVEPNAMAVLQATSGEVERIEWVGADLALADAIRLLYDRVGRWMTCDPIDRVTVLSWAALSLARHALTLRPVLTFKGPAGVGKSVAARLLAVLFHGWKRLLARPTPKSLYAAGDHPVTVVDNVEERNRAAVEDWLLIAATGGQRTIGTREGGTLAQKVDTFALLTSIVVSGRYELLTRLIPIECGKDWITPGFSEQEVLDDLARDRSVLLCGLIRLWSDAVWARWDEVKALAELIPETHIAWRQRESLAAMGIIGEELGRCDSRITALDARGLVTAWRDRLEERVGVAAVHTDPVLAGLRTLIRAWNRVSWGGGGRYWQQWLEEEVAQCQPIYLHTAGDRVTPKVGQSRVRKRQGGLFPVVAGFEGTHQDLHADIVRAMRAVGLADRFLEDIPDGAALSARWSQVTGDGWCREKVAREGSGKRQWKFRFFIIEALDETFAEGEPGEDAGGGV